MISKELLSEVLDRAVLHIEPELNNFNEVIYTDEYDMSFYINIYELAHKCKEWAWKTLNKIVSSEVSVDDWVSIVAYFYGNLTVNIEESFSAETEPKAIFKACDYIFKELSNK